jgi:tRNA(fMet)-specific endonuclease VapC
MPLYMLDTNILSDMIRNPNGVITQKIIAVGEKSIVTSIIVAAELRFGAAKRGSPKLTAQVEAVLAAIRLLPWEAPADAHYANIRTALENHGTIIGANDLLIAAHASSLSSILVSDNVKEFKRVAGLEIENWLG